MAFILLFMCMSLRVHMPHEHGSPQKPEKAMDPMELEVQLTGS